VNQCKDPAFQDAKRDEALLTIVKTIVFQGDGMAVENAFGIQEIKTVFPEILRPFGFIPRHPHRGSVVTLRNYVKGWLSWAGWSRPGKASRIPNTLTASAESGYTDSMADSLLKMPTDEEPDPFRYGSRWKRIHLPNGEVSDQEIPLTPEDLLDPQPGDEIPQSDPHAQVVTTLYGLLKRQFESAQDVVGPLRHED
jgi:hypothetical protein